MRNRLLAVAKTYWTRPLVWVLGLGWLALLFGPFLVGGGNRTTPSHPEVELPRATIESLEQLNYVRERGIEADVKGLRLDWLGSDITRDEAVWNEERQAWEASGDPEQMDVLDVVDEFRNVEVLVYNGQLLTPTDLARLSRLTQVKQLSLSGVQVYDKFAEPRPGKGTLHRFAADDLAALSGLTQLEVLDLSQCDFTGGLHHLASLPRLHTLILASFEHLDNAALADLAHLPHLRTLVISPDNFGEREGDPEKGVTDAGLLALADVPQLRTVYVGSRGPYTVPVDKLRALLPDVRVRRGFYSVARAVTTVWMGLQASMVLSVLLCLHTLAQFSLPAAHLMPRFEKAHLQIPLGLLSVQITGLTALFVSHDAALLPSLSFVTASLAAILGLGYCFISYLPMNVANVARWGKKQQWAFSVAAVMLVAGAVAMQFSSPAATIDAFLLGDAGWPASLLLLLLGGAGILMWSRRYSGEAQRFAAAGVTVALTWGDYARQQADLQMNMPGYVGGSIWMRVQRRFLDAALGQPREAHTISLRLWRAGVMQTRMFAVYMAVPMFLLFAGFHWSGFLSPGMFEPGSGGLLSAIVPAMMMVPVMGVFQISNSWRQRVPILVTESLRPLTRQHLRRLTFLGIARDFVPMGLLFLGVGGGLIFITPSLGSFLMVAAGVAALSAIFLVGLYAFTMWMLLVRRMWVVFLVVAVAYFAGTALFIAVTIGKPDVASSVTGVHVALLLGGLFAAVCLWLAYAWRRWGTVEFGMLDR